MLELYMNIIGSRSFLCGSTLRSTQCIKEVPRLGKNPSKAVQLRSAHHHEQPMFEGAPIPPVTENLQVLAMENGVHHICSLQPDPVG